MQISSARCSFTVKIVVVFITWYIVSSVSSIVNKIMLQKYPYPMTVALASLCSVDFYATMVLRFWQVRENRVSRYYMTRYIIPISIGKAVAVVSAYVSIWKVPVSYAQTIKATMPLFAIISARIFLHERQSTCVYISLIPIISGVTIATFTEISFNLSGLFSALLSTGIYSVLNVFVKKVLDSTKLHPLYLLSLNTRISAIVLFPVWGFRDGLLLWKKIVKSGNEWSHYDPYFVLYLLLSGLLSFLQNLCAFTLIQLLSALSYAVANAAKRITVISASLLTLHNPVTPTNVFGMFLSITGVLLYNRAKQYDEEHRHGLPRTRTDHTMSDASLIFLDGEAIRNKVYISNSPSFK